MNGVSRNIRLALLSAAGVGLGSAASAELVYGVTTTGFLASWRAGTPGVIQMGAAIQGLQSNEQLVGIDFRPLTGELFGLGSFSRLYRLDVASGMATEVGVGPFSPALNGSSFGFDFNPTIDRIRVDANSNQNLVLNPDTGAATVATNLFYRAGDVNEGVDPNVVHASYTPSTFGAPGSSTQLFGIDTGLDILVKQANSAGTLDTVGSIGADATEMGGFDISWITGRAFMVFQDVNLNRSTFWRIDLDTGEGTFVGEIGGGALITAVAVVPAPSAAALFGAALLGGVSRRRR